MYTFAILPYLIKDWKETFFFTPCIIKVDKTISLQSLLHEWMNKMHGISPTWDLPLTYTNSIDKVHLVVGRPTPMDLTAEMPTDNNFSDGFFKMPFLMTQEVDHQSVKETIFSSVEEKTELKIDFLYTRWPSQWGTVIVFLRVSRI